MTHNPQGHTRLELFVASLMRPSDDLESRLAGARIPRHDLARTQEWARANGLLAGRLIDAASFKHLFGEPSQEENERMVFELRLWPEHFFDAGLTPSGGVFYQGFRLKSAALAHSRSVAIEQAPERLLVGRHTWREVNAMLGSPDESHAWDPLEDWFYGPRSDDVYLTLSFDFGLLCGVSWGPYTRMQV